MTSHTDILSMTLRNQVGYPQLHRPSTREDDRGSGGPVLFRTAQLTATLYCRGREREIDSGQPPQHAEIDGRLAGVDS
jgi:hypothetical protein